MYRQSAHPYHVRFGFRKACRKCGTLQRSGLSLGLVAGPGALLLDRSPQLGLFRPLRLRRRCVNLPVPL